MCTDKSTQSGLQIAPKCVVDDDNDASDDDMHKVLSNISQSNNDSISTTTGFDTITRLAIVQMYDEIVFWVPQHNTTQQLVRSFNKSISNKTSHLYLLHYAAVVWTPKLYTSVIGECSENGVNRPVTAPHGQPTHIGGLTVHFQHNRHVYFTAAN